MTGGGTRARHVYNIGVDLGMPTGVLSKLGDKVSWQTEGSGPARRIYHLTPEGEEVLSLWIDYMQKQADNLIQFIQEYQKLS